MAAVNTFPLWCDKHFFHVWKRIFHIREWNFSKRVNSVCETQEFKAFLLLFSSEFSSFKPNCEVPSLTQQYESKAIKVEILERVGWAGRCLHWSGEAMLKLAPPSCGGILKAEDSPWGLAPATSAV